MCVYCILYRVDNLPIKLKYRNGLWLNAPIIKIINYCKGLKNHLVAMRTKVIN